MVTTYGMSERIGLTTLERPANIFLAQEQQIDFDKKYSPETAKIIDEEVKKILSDNYEKVKGIIEDNRGIIEKVASELLKHEVMDEKTFSRLLRSDLIRVGK